MVPYRLGNFAVVARAQYKRLCLRPNNFEVCRPRPAIFDILVQSMHYCTVLASNCQSTTGLWHGVSPENVKFYRNDRFHARHIRHMQQCAAAISANQTTEWGTSTARWLCVSLCALIVGRRHATRLAAKPMRDAEIRFASIVAFSGASLCQLWRYTGNILVPADRQHYILIVLVISLGWPL